MPKRSQILTISQAFFSGGARILHNNLIKELHDDDEHSQQHTVLTAYSQVQREKTMQNMEHDRGFQLLRDAGIAVGTLGRQAHVPFEQPYTDAEIKLFEENTKHADLLLFLKEQPVGLLLQSKVTKPAIVMLHRSDPEHQGSAFTDLKNAVLDGRVHMCTISAVSAKEAYVKAGIPADKITAILNGIDLDIFSYSLQDRRAVRKELKIPARAPVVVFVARYDTGMKDIPLFLKSVKQLFIREPNAHIIMCGTGMADDNAELGAAIGRYITGSDTTKRQNIHLLGVRHDMPRVYSAADIVSSTSKHGETYPLCLLEGMACGVIPVATNVGDTAHMIRSGRGILTSRSPKEIAAGWQYALYNRRMFKTAITRDRHTFSKDHMVQEYAAVMQPFLATA